MSSRSVACLPYLSPSSHTIAATTASSPYNPASPFFLFFFLRIRRPPRSTLFPCTTLFRSLLNLTRIGRPAYLAAAALALVFSGPAAAQTGIKFSLDGRLEGPEALVLLPQDKGYFKRSEEHTSELQSHLNLVCRLLLEKKKN